jgi:hypothetical protein
MVQATQPDRSPYTNLVKDIKELISLNNWCSIVKVDRGLVRVGHLLANFARTERRTVIWFGFEPEVV